MIEYVIAGLLILTIFHLGSIEVILKEIKDKIK